MVMKPAPTDSKTVQLYCDADKSRGHKHDLVNGSVVTKSSMGRRWKSWGLR